MHNETHPFEGTIHPWHGGCQRCGHPEDHEIHAVDVMEPDLLGGPDEIPPAREPIYDRLTEPPHSVRVCPYCGLEVVGTRVGADPDDTVDGCDEHGIIEAVSVDVPVHVFEAGPEAVLEYLARAPR